MQNEEYNFTHENLESALKTFSQKKITELYVHDEKIASDKKLLIHFLQAAIRDIPDVYISLKVNASLIDNLNTVINTMNAIIMLVDETNNIPDLLAKAKKAFQAAPQKMNISKKIWDGLEETAQSEVLETIGATGTSVKGSNIQFDIPLKA